MSPKLFNIYINDLIREWKSKTPAMLFADDKVVIQRNEYDRQIAVFRLHQLRANYNMVLPINKTKTMTFYGNNNPKRRRRDVRNCQVHRFRGLVVKILHYYTTLLLLRLGPSTGK